MDGLSVYGTSYLVAWSCLLILDVVLKGFIYQLDLFIVLCPSFLIQIQQR